MVGRGGRRAAGLSVVADLRALAARLAPQSESRIRADADAYWRTGGNGRWRADSHWRDAEPFADGDLWDRIGRRHLDLYDTYLRFLGRDGADLGRVLEWGCGGGANAVHFGPRAQEFVAVDVSQKSLDECRRQVGAVADVPFRAIAVDVDTPEAVMRQVTEPCDVFLCFYVFELLPSPAYGVRLLRIAHDLLRPGGVAVVQVKYRDDSWRSLPRRRGYRRGPADMTTYRIEEFWALACRAGLRPHAVTLVPVDALDERYAYFLLTREAAAA